MATAIGSGGGNENVSDRDNQSATPPTPKRIGTFLIVVVFLTTVAVILFRFSMKELGVALIGLAVPVAGLLDKYLLSRKGKVEGKVAKVERAGPTWMVALAWVIAYALGYLTPSVAAWLSSPSVSVRFDHSGPVNPSEVVEVNWARLPENRSPELFVYSVQLKLYFPQECGLPKSRKGRQQCKIQFGLGPVGYEYEIVSATLDEEARQQLLNYSHDPVSRGLQRLPDTAMRVGSFKVRN